MGVRMDGANPQPAKPLELTGGIDSASRGQQCAE